MGSKKIFILIPDGVGLRNFAYTNFYNLAKGKGFEVTFWNDTPFDLEAMGFREIKIRNSRMHPLTNILKMVRIQLDLDQNISKTGDKVYDYYRFPFSYRNMKSTLRSMSVQLMVMMSPSKQGLERIRKKISTSERETDYYKNCLAVLQKEQPELVFCTNQRTVLSIAPILAAQDLKIPTATFIFSWDNLPKATLSLETDYYFVWSEYMKKELMFYYDYISDDQVIITGTPQFSPHTDESLIMPRETFFAAHHLDPDKKYICFSGDDITTSPDDPQYLADTAEAVRSLNGKGHRVGIIFRRCPVDFSDRYDEVVAQYADIVTPVSPRWEKIGGGWNAILPTPEDLTLQMNTIAHTEMAINLGSSMVFDYVSFGKPCAYINYNVPDQTPGFSVQKIYSFVHFRSMPTKESVIWLNSKEGIVPAIESVLSSTNETIVSAAKQWFSIINRHPVKDASLRILEAFDTIIANSRRKK